MDSAPSPSPDPVTDTPSPSNALKNARRRLSYAAKRVKVTARLAKRAEHALAVADGKHLRARARLAAAFASVSADA